MLIGEYCHSIDAKGRIIIPSKFREDLGSSFVVSRGLDNCLYLYSAVEWGMFENELLSQKNAKARKLHKFFFTGAAECEIDQQGRVVIPQSFREFAELKKDVVVLGVSNRAEIWDKAKWENYKKDESFSAEEIAKVMEELGM